MKWRKPRIIAPRLSNGESREAVGHGLPGNIKQALRMRAASAGKSLSWMLEQDLIELYRLRGKVEYQERKEHELDKPHHQRKAKVR